MKKTPHIQQRRFCLQKFILFFCVITAADPSHSFRMTLNVSLIMTPCRPSSFWTGARMLCEKDRKRDSDTEQRIHYFDGVLPFPVIQSFGKNVLWEKRESAIWHKAKNLLHWWHFTAFLLTVIDPSRSFRMTLNVSLIMTLSIPYR